MTGHERLIRFVAKNPGCTSRQIGEALGISARANCATLAVRGDIRRVREPNPNRCDVANVWHYYPTET